MQCPCGFEPPEDAKYCQECGKKLRAVGDPLLELPWDTMPDKFSAEDLARYMGVSDYVVWNLTCKPRFPHSERKNIINKEKLREWFIGTGWIYKPKTPPKTAPPPSETVEKVDWTQKPAILTMKEMMEIFSCSKWTIDAFTRRRGGIPHFRIGQSIRYKTEEVIKWGRQFKDPMMVKYLERREL